MGVEAGLYPISRGQTGKPLHILPSRVDLFPIVLALVAPVSDFDVVDSCIVGGHKEILRNSVPRVCQACGGRNHWDGEAGVPEPLRGLRQLGASVCGVYWIAVTDAE